MAIHCKFPVDLYLYLFACPGYITLLISFTCPVSQGLSEREPVVSSSLGSLRKCANCSVVKPLSILCMFTCLCPSLLMLFSPSSPLSHAVDLSSRLCVDYAALWISGCPHKQRMYHPRPSDLWTITSCVILKSWQEWWEKREICRWLKMWREVVWTSEVREHGCFATISLIWFLLILVSLTTTCQLQTSSVCYKEQVWVRVGGVVGVKCVFYWASSGVFHIHLLNYLHYISQIRCWGCFF